MHHSAITCRKIESLAPPQFSHRDIVLGSAWYIFTTACSQVGTKQLPHLSVRPPNAVCQLQTEAMWNVSRDWPVCRHGLAFDCDQKVVVEVFYLKLCAL